MRTRIASKARDRVGRRIEEKERRARGQEEEAVTLKEAKQGERKTERRSQKQQRMQTLGEEQRRGDQLYTIQKKGRNEVWKPP